ncbi:sulfotransferase [Micromonospora sediminicola]|uniref:sulfotransferase n=1 Tax=Micromonospora sediminicola TaxID=946078 RepID=UPI0033D5C0FB
MPSPFPVFVAGTGRSGTSRIADIIGEHPLIHRIPMETRFLVDPGGLRDLTDALTDRYDPVVAEDALHRLGELLTVRLPGRRDDRGRTVPELVGERRYRDAVHQLWPQLIAATYDEPAPPEGFGNGDRPAGPFAPVSRRRVLPRYFRDRAYLKPVYHRWLTWKQTADLTGRRYVEVKAEDLAADWPGQRRALFARLGVDDVVTASTFQSHRLTHRADPFDDETRRSIEEALGPVIPAMGYGYSTAS